MTLTATVAVTGPLGLAAAPAQAAGSAGLLAVVDGTVVEYRTATGKQSTITLTRQGTTITVDDRVAIKVGAGCKLITGDTTKARCTPAAAPTLLRVSAYDRTDTIVNSTDLPIIADGGTAKDTLTGGPGNDQLFGHTGDDVLKGGGGNDALHGGTGDDRLYGGAGNDSLDDGTGTDVAWGSTGSDSFANGPGNDKFYGEAGDDNYNSRQLAGKDADLFRGGAGVDSAGYTRYTSAVSLDLDGRKDDGRTGEGDTIGTDVENLLGGLGNDRLDGDSKANRLDGREGNDRLYGNGGNDTLLGGRGVDRMYGGAGDDRLDGNVVLGVYDEFDEVYDTLDGGTNTAVGDTCVFPVLRLTTGCEQS